MIMTCNEFRNSIWLSRRNFVCKWLKDGPHSFWMAWGDSQGCDFAGNLRQIRELDWSSVFHARQREPLLPPVAQNEDLTRAWIAE